METDGKKKYRVKISLGYKRLVMFDFDETLAQTEEVTLVREKETDRIIDHLRGQSEFDNYDINEKKHYFDFSEFLQVSRFAEPIDATVNLMKEYLADSATKVVILTARQQRSTPAIEKYLQGLGVDTEELTLYGCDGSKNKYNFLTRIIETFKPKREVIVFEDSVNNIKSLLQLEYDYPDLSFDFIQVIDPENTDEDLEEARKHRYPQGETGTEPYQRLLKRIHPAKKRRLLGLGANDYLVKGTKKVKDYKRSKSAPPGG